MAALGPRIERVGWLRWAVTVPCASGPGVVHDDGMLIIPMTALGGWTHTKFGARRMVREFKRQIAAEAA